MMSVKVTGPLAVSCYEYSCCALVGEACTLRMPRCRTECRHEDVRCFHASRVRRWDSWTVRELNQTRGLRRSEENREGREDGEISD